MLPMTVHMDAENRIENRPLDPELPTEIEKPAGKAALALTEVDQDPDLSILLTLQSIKPPISRIRPLYPYLIVL